MKSRAEYLKLNRFEKSLVDNPLPKNSWEKRFRIHTGISNDNPKEDIEKLKEVYGNIEVRYRKEKSKSCILIEFERDRTLEEVAQYKRDRVQHPIFRWLRDGQRRFQTIVDDKIKSIDKYELLHFLSGYDDNELQKIGRKKRRLKFYQDKIDYIDHVMNNYEEYTYEELEGIPTRVFDQSGGIKE